MMCKPGTNEVERVRMRRNKISDLLLGKVSTVSAMTADTPVNERKRTWAYDGEVTYFGCLGSLTS